MDVRRTFTAGAALLLVGAAAAGCGSGSGSGSASTGSSGSAAAGTIKIGTIGAFSGAQASSEAGAEKVIKAWAQSVNDKGGIGGHKVELIVKDLGDNVTGGLAAAKALVEQEKVVAIVGEQDNADSTWASYVAGKGVPVIGGLSINIPFATNPMFFPAGANVFATIYGGLLNAKQAGGTFAFLYCAESPQCASAVPLVQGIAQAVGVKVPLAVKVSGTAPDYTGVCQQLKDSGAQSYQVGSGAAVIVRIAAACAKAGVTAKPLNQDGAATELWTKEPALQGALVTETVFPFTSTNGAGPQAYQALLAKYLPDLGEQNGPNAAYSFVAGRLFEKAAAGAGSDITSASLLTGLYALKGETLEGLTPPLTYTQGKPTQVNCFFTMGLTKGAFTDVSAGTPTCAPDALVGGILQQLATSGS